MMDLMSLVSFLLFLIVINFISFLCMKEDKERAKRDQWRIPEAVLLGCALLGGCIGGGIGMVRHKHKTKKLAFLLRYCMCSCCAGFICIPIFLLINA